MNFIILPNYMVYFSVYRIWHKGKMMQSNTKLYHSNPFMISTQTYHKHESKI